MTPAQKQWIKTIHVAKKQLKLTDEMYLAILEGAAGVTSSTQITTWQQYQAVIAAFKASGFAIKKGTYQRPANRITYRQEEYIKHLWQQVSRQKTEKSLNVFVKNITGVDDLRFATKNNATKVITALRAIAIKQGINPDQHLN